jgi:hypothetical protein
MQAACVFAEKRAEKRAAVLDATADYAFAAEPVWQPLHTQRLPFLCYFFSAFQWF